MNAWGSSKLRKCENSGRDQDPAPDAARMDLLSDVIICIYAGTASEKQPQNLVSKSMSRS